MPVMTWHSMEWYRPYSQPWESVWKTVTHWMPLPQPVGKEE